jgi:hypothetical protein
VLSEQLDGTIDKDVLIGAVNFTRSFKLEIGETRHNDYASLEDRELAKRCQWFLYSVEIPYYIRRGISAVRATLPDRIQMQK